MNLIVHCDINYLVQEYFDLVCPKLATPRKDERIYHKHSVYCRIEEKLNKYSGKTEEELFSKFKLYYYKILTGNMHDLVPIIEEIEEVKNRKSLRYKKRGANNKLVDSDLMKDIKYCFDYDKYSGDKPYHILEKLDVKACPYCNRQYINTYRSKDGRTRATLDHFYPKSKFPYLAISFYNLIPSCYACNSGIKGDTTFTYETHLNPFMSSFEGMVGFTINYKKAKNSEDYIAEFYTNPDYMKIDFKQIAHANTKDYKRSRKNIEEFCLIDLYNLHKDQVLKLLQKDVLYSKAGLAKSLFKSFPKIFKDEDDVLDTLIDFKTDHKSFNDVPFSRMMRDLGNEFNLNNRLL